MVLASLASACFVVYPDAARADTRDRSHAVATVDPVSPPTTVDAPRRAEPRASSSIAVTVKPLRLADLSASAFADWDATAGR